MSTIWIVNQYGSTPETGMGGRNHYLAEALGKSGHKVFFVIASWHHLLRNGDAENLPLIEKRDYYTLIRIPVPRYKHAHSKKRVLNWFLFRRRISRLHKRISDKPDAILFSSPGLVPYPGIERIARRLGARLIFEVRDIWPLTLVEVGGMPKSHPLVKYLQRIEDRAYQSADAVVSNLPHAVEHMITRGLDRRKFHWVPNGFSAKETNNPEPLEEKILRRLPDVKFLIGYTGTLGKANALDVMVSAAEILKDEPSVGFVIVGSGGEEDRLKEMISVKGLKNVHLTGPIPKRQIQSMLAKFDACYIGLTPDPLFRFGVSPNKLFDYLVSGKPILYGIDSGKYKPIEDAKAGFQVAPGDPVALAKAIFEMINLPLEEREKMGENGQTTAMQKYEYDALAQKLEGILLNSSNAKISKEI